MEEGLNQAAFLKTMNKSPGSGATFSLDPFIMNGISLAYIGDAVFELLARNHALSEGSSKPDKLHKRSVFLVNALSQSKMADSILGNLDERELAIFRRGRNTSSGKFAKHINITDYKKATGLEALFGYLFLSGQNERLNELFSDCVQVAMVDSQDREK